MKKNRWVVMLLMGVLLVGCSPQKRLTRLLEKHPLPENVVIKDSIIYRDSLVEVKIPGDTVRDSILVPFYMEMPDTSLKTASAWAEAEAGITEGEFWLELRQKDTIVPVQVDSVIVEKERVVEMVKTVEVIKKGSLFWKHGFLVLAGLIVLGLVLFFLLRR